MDMMAMMVKGGCAVIGQERITEAFAKTSDGVERVTAACYKTIDNTSISYGWYGAFLVNHKGEVIVNGSDIFGELGLGGGNAMYVNPIKVGTDTDWVKISNGSDYNSSHTMAIKSDGTLWATGSNGVGELGLGDNSDRTSFTKVGIDTDWKDVYCGAKHTIALKQNGTLWSTGYNAYGQLGLSDSANRNIFTQIGADTDWHIISCGPYHTMAIKTGGTLWGTGRNNYIQLGLSGTSNRYSFTQIGADTDWSQVSTAVVHTMAIKSDGTLWGVGNNTNGELGLGDYSNRTSFTQIGAETTWTNVKTGGGYIGYPLLGSSMAIKSDATLWATGNNDSGQLGLGDTASRNQFTQVGNIKSEHIVCGWANVMVITVNGYIYVSGMNDHAELGVGDVIQRNSLTYRGEIKMSGRINL